MICPSISPVVPLGVWRRSNYDSTSITVLEGLEAVRKRPGMYIGDVHDGSGCTTWSGRSSTTRSTSTSAASAREMDVTIHFDGSVTVEDNGRGIPVGIMPERGVSAAEVVMTVLHAGGKFDTRATRSARVARRRRERGQRRERVAQDGDQARGPRPLPGVRRGAPVAPLAVIGDTDKTGTKMSFKPDHDIFTATEFQYDILASRLRELSFLNAGFVITSLTTSATAAGRRRSSTRGGSASSSST
jgi:DNA gyrase subunit B